VPARLALPDPQLLRLAKELGRIAKGTTITPQPPPLAAGESILCPDLILERDGHHTYVELIGFWTIEFLESKRALYREAGIADVVFCIDAARACTKDRLPDEVSIVLYTKHMTAAAHELAEHVRAK
jgi:predicted nuclease of restriction endonuclease-like RecB superfamily